MMTSGSICGGADGLGEEVAGLGLPSLGGVILAAGKRVNKSFR